MSKGIHLDDYHTKVNKRLKAKLDWLKSSESYPELKGPLDTPCAFFAVTGWEPLGVQPGDRALDVNLHSEVILVVGKESEMSQRDARNAAMAVSLAIQNERFGMPVQPAKLVSAHPDALSPELDPYVVWAVDMVQEVNIGSSAFTDEVRGGIRFAINPEDDSNPTEYHPLESQP